MGGGGGGTERGYGESSVKVRVKVTGAKPAREGGRKGQQTYRLPTPCP